MPTLIEKFNRIFEGAPSIKHLCPKCNVGHLIPVKDSFKAIEPEFSKRCHAFEEWDPDWIEVRFSYCCICSNEECGEVAFVSGDGSVDQRYDYNGNPEYFDFFRIQNFYPSPDIISIPEETPGEVTDLLKKSFSLYWMDTSAASNALRASLEALLDELGIPASQVNSNGATTKLTLHRRIELWAETHEEFAELTFALKEVGNLGSHGERVLSKHYFGALEIFEHILQQLFRNNASKMKELAEKIRSEIRAR